VRDLPTFREVYRRCIVPVDGFFEWKAIKGQKAKQPYAVAIEERRTYQTSGLRCAATGQRSSGLSRGPRRICDLWTSVDFALGEPSPWAMWPVAATTRRCHISTNSEGLLMAEPTNSLVAFSDAAAQLVERTASSIVAVHGGGRWPSSGIHWHSGVVVTAEEVLEQDEDIKVMLPGGRVVAASLAGRDPSTDVAVLRFQPDGLPAAPTADAASLLPGHVVLAIGNHEGAPMASLGIVAIAGPAWHSVRGGTIDSLIRLDLALSPAAEGGAVIDVQGRVVGMAVLGPRRRALAIPTSTIDRVVDQLLAKGHVFRGYLGAGLQPVRLGRRSNGAQSSGIGRGILVASIDPDGPAARAGLLVGDVVTTWNAKPVDRVREVMRLLGSDSIGNTVDLGLLRGGAPTTLKVVIGERPVA
jgi:S1-C subfamily serine protease